MWIINWLIICLCISLVDACSITSSLKECSLDCYWCYYPKEFIINMPYNYYNNNYMYTHYLEELVTTDIFINNMCFNENNCLIPAMEIIEYIRNTGIKTEQNNNQLGFFSMNGNLPTSRTRRPDLFAVDYHLLTETNIINYPNNHIIFRNIYSEKVTEQLRVKSSVNCSTLTECINNIGNVFEYLKIQYIVLGSICFFLPALISLGLCFFGKRKCLSERIDTAKYIQYSVQMVISLIIEGVNLMFFLTAVEILFKNKIEIKDEQLVSLAYFITIKEISHILIDFYTSNPDIEPKINKFNKFLLFVYDYIHPWIIGIIGLVFVMATNWIFYLVGMIPFFLGYPFLVEISKEFYLNIPFYFFTYYEILIEQFQQLILWQVISFAIDIILPTALRLIFSISRCFV